MLKTKIKRVETDRNVLTDQIQAVWRWDDRTFFFFFVSLFYLRTTETANVSLFPLFEESIYVD